MRELPLCEDPRIAALQGERWIKTRLHEHAIALIENLMHAPPRHGPHCLMIVGDASMGKTAIARTLLKRYPPVRDAKAEHDVVRILYVTVPEGPDLMALLARMLRRLGHPLPPSRRRLFELREQVAALCEKLGVRIIIIDEIQHLLAGGPQQQEKFRNLIKDLSNDLKVPIVAMGVESARRALFGDLQLRRRFRLLRLSTWSYDEDFLNLLVTLERVIALAKPSHLTQSVIARRILEKTDGLTGLIIELVTEAAIHAIRDGSERITLETLDKCAYIDPILPGSLDF